MHLLGSGPRPDDCPHPEMFLSEATGCGKSSIGTVTAMLLVGVSLIIAPLVTVTLQSDQKMKLQGLCDRDSNVNVYNLDDIKSTHDAVAFCLTL